jgi:hypothetical protein
VRDEDYWKERYQHTWERSDQRERAIIERIRQEADKLAVAVGLGAGSTEYLSGSAASCGYVRERSKSLRPELIALKEAMLEAHPETADNRPIGQRVIQRGQNAGVDLSFDRFDQLARGEELREGEKPTNTVYDSLPDKRNIEEEEPTPERQMLDMINARLDQLWIIKNQGGPDVDEGVQSTYVRLDGHHNNFLKNFVDWKRAAPERAMRELLAMAKVMGRDVARNEEPDIDQMAWVAAMVMSDVAENTYDEDFYKSLLNKAADGLRSRLS